ncbi:MAG: chromate transporter [Alphaproteobacteria bacterium]|nr:chromate transporter [Alphaproteobacteria bacterium]
MSEATATPAQKVSLLAIYKVFFSIGVMSFGGGLVPWMQREIITLRGWMKDEDFLPGVALAQILPGVNSTNLAVFIGQKLRGLAGAGVALTGMLTGPFLVMIAATATYQVFIDYKPLQVAMTGIAAAAIGMILRTGVSAVKASLDSVLSIAVMLATFIAIGVLKWPLIQVVAVMVPLSVAAAWPRGGASGKPDKDREKHNA